MKNFKKQLANQQKVNEAVNAIFNHFDDYGSYCEHYRTMANAQAEIMQMMELSLLQAANGGCGVAMDDIASFICDVQHVYKLLQPFADMMGQVYGNED